MPVRACVPARARRHHLWEERCALRPGLRWGDRRGGERLPWRAERGRILMGGHGHCPHSCPPLAALSSHSFLRLPPPLGRAPSAHALHTDPGPWVPGHHHLISAAMGPARPKGDGLALRGSLPGRVPAPPSGLCNRKRGSALAIRRPPGGKAGQGERKGAPGPAVCLPMRPGQRPTWASSASPNSRAWLWGRE